MRNLLLVACLMCSLPAAAEKLLAVTIDSWPPYMFQQDGELTGIAVDTVDMLFAEAQVDVNIRAYPWARAYYTAKNRQNTLIFPLFRTPEREPHFQWVGPIVPSFDMLFFKKKSRTDIAIEQLEDAKKYRVVVVRNVANHKYMLKQGFKDGSNLEVVSTPEQAAKMLFAERVDVLIGSEHTLPWITRQLGLSYDELESVYTVLEGDPAYIGFNKNTPPEIVEKIRHILAMDSTLSKIEEIRQRYLSDAVVNLNNAE